MGQKARAVEGILFGAVLKGQGTPISGSAYVDTPICPDVTMETWSIALGKSNELTRE